MTWSSKAACSLLARATAFSLAIGCASCGSWLGAPQPAPLPPGPSGGFGPDTFGRISVKQAQDRPTVTSVVRQGDSLPAVAVAVLTEPDSFSAVALGALVEARLHAAGLDQAQARADRDGYRIRLLVPPAVGADRVVSAIWLALSTPIEPGQAELKAVRKALEALQQHPIDSVALLPVVQCTGELGTLPTQAPVDPSSPELVAKLEQLRANSHVAARVAFAAVGPAPFASAVASAVEQGQPWPAGQMPEDPWPASDSLASYSLSSRTSGPLLHIAARVPDAYAATAMAHRAAQPDGPLMTRLSAATNWSLARVSATVRPRGACVSLTLRSNGSSTQVENDAARMAALVTREIENELAEARADGSVAGRQVLQAADPRDAAGLAAWWSLASRLPPGPDRFAIALGVPPPRLTPRDSADALEARIREASKLFREQFRLSRAAWDRPVVQARTHIEAGQGELWLLLASPCGAGADTASDAGLTALAAIAATGQQSSYDGVTVEPWIAPDGVGVIAHAEPRPGEGPHALAGRVADAAGRAIMRPVIAEPAYLQARAALLALVQPVRGTYGRSFGALARQFSPERPSMLSAFGLYEPVLEASASAASMRWLSLASGPMRVAVIANVDHSQAQAAVRAADRWLVHRTNRQTTCPLNSALSVPDLAGKPPVIVPAGRSSPHALVGVVLPRPSTDDLTMLEMLANALEGSEGLLQKALAKYSVRGDVRVVGGPHLSAMIIELGGRPTELSEAVEQARALLGKLGAGAATDADLNRAHTQLQRQDVQDRLEPRRRLADLWRGRAQTRSNVTLASWNLWMQKALNPIRIGVVLATDEPSAEQQP